MYCNFVPKNLVNNVIQKVVKHEKIEEETNPSLSFFSRSLPELISLTIPARGNSVNNNLMYCCLYITFKQKIYLSICFFFREKKTPLQSGKPMKRCPTKTLCVN